MTEKNWPKEYVDLKKELAELRTELKEGTKPMVGGFGFIGEFAFHPCANHGARMAYVRQQIANLEKQLNSTN